MLKQTVQKTLHMKRANNISALRVINPGFIIGKLQNMFRSRAGIYRMLVLCSTVHILGTFGGSLFIERNVMLRIEDYMENENIKENDLFQLFGVLKVGSIQMKKGSLETKFKITDFQNEIDVVYNGTTRFEFREGETIVLTGYIANKNIRNKVICVDYQTKHSMEENDWQDQQNKPRFNFGLQ